MTGEFVNLSRPSLRYASLERPERVRLPSGYILSALPDTDDDGGEYLLVSVYPPGSDCVDKDDRVGEIRVWKEDADVLLRMSARPRSCDHRQCPPDRCQGC